MYFGLKKRLVLTAIARGLSPPENEINRTLELVQLKRVLDVLDINCVLDVGANVGQFAQEVRRIGYRSLIVSFEPQRREFAELQQTFHEDRLWRGFRVALSDRHGSATLNVNPDLTVMSSLLQPVDSLQNMAVETVEIRRLDEVFPEATSGLTEPRVLLKMDTQGYDLKVFAGAEGCLGSICALLSEVSDVPLYLGMPHYLEALALYEKAGFDLVELSVVSRNAAREIQELNCLMTRGGVIASRLYNRAIKASPDQLTVPTL